MVGYTSCRSNSAAMERSMDTEKGIFVAPEDGDYEVSFTGLLKSYGGRRVWATLYKLDENDTGTCTEKTKKTRKCRIAHSIIIKCRSYST